MKVFPFLSVLVVFLSVLSTYAQEIESLVSDDSKRIGENRFFISKEASQFVKVNNLPMDLYAGKLDIVIPLYEIKEGDITVPISLKYLSGGVKVNDEASIVGLGWVLDAGGSVNKMVRDIEDHKIITMADFDQDLRNGNEYGFAFRGHFVKDRGSLVTNKMVEDYDFGTGEGKYSVSSINAVRKYKRLFDLVSEDLLPDLFFLNAPGISSTFIVERFIDNSLRVSEVNKKNNKFNFLKYSKFSVDHLGSDLWLGMDNVFPKRPPSNAAHDEILFKRYFNFVKNFGADYEGFDVINSSGIRYKFATNDINIYSPKQYPIDHSMRPIDLGDPYLTFVRNNYSISKGTWHLDMIEDPNTGRKVNFKYQNYIKKSVKELNNYSHLAYMNYSGPYYAYKGRENFLTFKKDIDTHVDETYLHNDVLKNYIQEINWSEGKVLFFYEHFRTDMNYGEGFQYALSRIEVRNIRSELIKRIEFEYGNFGYDENYLPMPTLKRLKLNTISEVSNIGTKRYLYQFKYDESQALANKGSFKSDFLGYFNGNVSTSANSVDISTAIPKIYFLAGKGRNSFIPFAHPRYTPLNNGYSLEANPSTVTLGSLTKIINEMGGTNEFIYEPNDFRFENHTIIGGGIRVKSQIIKDEEVLQSKINYKYTDDEGKSSGRILAIPNYATISAMNWVPGTFDIKNMQMYIYNGVTQDIELTRGGSVGYKKVTEIEEKLGRTESFFTTVDEYPNEFVGVHDQSFLGFVKHSAFATNYYWDNDFQRGAILRKNIFDQDNRLKREEIYNYETRTYEGYGGRVVKRELDSQYSYKYEIFTELSFDVPFKRIKNFNLVSKEENFYEAGKFVSKKTKNFWNHKYNLLEEVVEENSNEVTKTVLRYPDPGENNRTHLPQEGSLALQNRISSPLVFKKYRGSDSSDLELITEEAVEYGSFNNQVLKKVLYSKKGVEGTIYSKENEIVSYDLYDNKGNLLQYTDAQGMPTSLIWSYRNTLPVVKMEGLPYSTLSSNYISFLQSAFDDGEMDIIYQLTSGLRKTYKNGFISTYIYKPLVGLIQTIDPKGTIESYEYDEFNRLRKIVDSGGNIVQEYEYNIR